MCLSEELTISLINKNIAGVLRLKNVPILGICFGFQLLVILKRIKWIQEQYRGVPMPGVINFGSLRLFVVEEARNKRKTKRERIQK